VSWTINDRSVLVTTALGSIAVRIDGDTGGPPLLLCQRFRGTMEDWDPEFIALLARGRNVIRFDSMGVGESAGIAPDTVRGMAEIVPALLDALGIDATDLLGWSLGGYVAQTVALDWPTRVRRLVIAGSGPGGPGGPPPDPRVAEIVGRATPTEADIQFLFFTNTPAGQTAARRHFDHIQFGERPPVATQIGTRQRQAIVAWWHGMGAAKTRLSSLGLPILVANGIADVMVPAEHSFTIARDAPNAKLILYPDSGHAFLFQYAHDFSAEVLNFLEEV
jgi:pimeloyl-ACP methyl ester carboxylesterase